MSLFGKAAATIAVSTDTGFSATLAASACKGVSGVAALLPLLRQLNDLKRIRVAGKEGSIAERLFLRAWGALLNGIPLRNVMLGETARAVAAARLAGIDAEVLKSGGIYPEGKRAAVLQNAFDSVGSAIEPNFANELRGTFTGEPLTDAARVHWPDFVLLLANQPRAGATRPGQARVVLEPTENHAEHCAIVAVNAALSAPLFGADPAQAFLTGLSHHFHNAYLPDAGDAGDALLGEHLQTLIDTFRRRAIQQLPPRLGEMAQQSLDSVFRCDTPESKAFQTADSLDRVLEMEWHARSAAFTLSVALDEMDIIHPGPVQAFQQEVMRAAGFFKPNETQ